jgi:hypothetical protein
MITGYNTDVRHRGLVFHVQTEDKGATNPCIESLIYYGGQVLKRKRSEYTSLLEQGEGKDAIVALMERQHRQTIGEIRTGKLDAEIDSQIGPLSTPETPAGGAGHAAVPAAGLEVPAASRSSSTQSLDQVILDYLKTEAQQEHLILVMDSPDELRLGDEAELAFEAKSSIAGDPIDGAAIAVKLISTASEPTTLGSGVTNEQGRLQLKVIIPATSQGTAALIVTATSSVGTAEIKHLI